MGIDNVVAQRVTDDPYRMGGTAPAPKNNGRRRRAELDADAQQKLHGRLMNWFYQERDKQAENRYQMALDEDFYDGLQWSDDDIAELTARGQAPLVFNLIKPTINWLLGTERRSRVDGKVLPRSDGDEEMAEVKSKLLKYVSDVNKTIWKRSDAFKNCVIAGAGWTETAIETDPTMELLAKRHVNWRNIYHDSNFRELDGSDMRYVFRWSFLDVDMAVALCPDKASLLQAAAIDDNQVGMDEDDVWYLGARVNNTTGDYAAVSRRGFAGSGLNIGRERVKVIECWYRVPVACQVCRAMDEDGMDWHGMDYDKANPAMAQALQAGSISVARHVRQEVRVALMTESHMLYSGKSPYRHNRFPFTPQWCYRRHRDGLPYGVIRDIRDAQIDYNKRASKALYILSTVRVVMDHDALTDGTDIEDLRAEVARPDAVIVKKRNAELRIEQDKELAEEHIKLMMFDGKSIRDVAGITDQNLGVSEHDLSGKAVGKLQDQGTMVTAHIFDNQRLAIQMETELELSLIEQFYTAPKVVRLVGENKPIEWLKINVYDEQAGKYLNDITRSAADFVVDEQDFRASTRQAMFESMMELVGKLEPQVGLALLDMVIDFADVPNKDEIVARIRKLNGQADPSRKQTPDEVAAQQQAQQEVAQVKQIQLGTLQAQLEKLQAEAKAASAKADAAAADVHRIVADAVQKGVTAAYEALQAAQIVATVPNVTPVADAILAGAGYQDQNGQNPDIPAPSGTLPSMTPQSAHGDYVGAPAAGATPPPAPAPGEQLQQADGAQQGIETPTPADNIRQ